MKIVVKRPAIEPHFGAVIYNPSKDPTIYRVEIGMEGTEMNYHGTLVDACGILPRENVERWVAERVRELRRNGKKVKFDENFSYLMACAIEELASESETTCD